MHPYLIFQVFIGSGPADSFQVEIQIRDKTNVSRFWLWLICFQTRRRIMFTDGSKDIISNAMHVRIPNSFIKRDQWINLCIDLNSFTRECFSTGPAKNATPMQQTALSRGSFRSNSKSEAEKVIKSSNLKKQNSSIQADPIVAYGN